jgi:hypothetical protein
MKNLFLCLLALVALNCSTQNQDWDSGGKARDSHMLEERQQQQEDLRNQNPGRSF